jgi:hypothetical protein
VLFDRAIDTTTTSAITLTVNGVIVPVRYNSFASGFGVELKAANLLTPNAQHSVAIRAGLLDANGLPITRLRSFQFTTGSAPDLTPARSLGTTPQYGVTLPANPIVALRGNKRIMPLAALEYTNLTGPQNPAATAAVSSDGATFTLTPLAPLVPGQQYSVNFTDIVDVTGAYFTTNSVSFSPGTDPAPGPPAILGTTVAD